MISTLTNEQRTQPRWFVMHTKPSDTKRLEQRLAREEINGKEALKAMAGAGGKEGVESIDDVENSDPQKASCPKMEAFVPRHYQVRHRAGRARRELVDVMPGYIFVRASQTALVRYKTLDNNLKFSVWPNPEGAAQYLWIADEEMEQFIRVCRNNEANVEYFLPGELTLKAGQKVEVVGGPWTGVKGTFQRVAGHRSRRLVLTLDNILSATVEIEPDLIRPLS